MYVRLYLFLINLYKIQFPKGKFGFEKRCTYSLGVTFLTPQSKVEQVEIYMKNFSIKIQVYTYNIHVIYSIIAQEITVVYKIRSLYLI